MKQNVTVPISISEAEVPCDLRIGTSGYSYVEWAEAGFYPPATPSGKMLPFYAQIFPVTELNYTWYQMPRADAVERMRRQVPAEFRFAAKLNRSLTHEIDPDRWRGAVKQYRDGIAPLLMTGQLAAILLQFPPSFHRTPPNRRYLDALLESLDGLPVAIEFRHISWAMDRVFEALAHRKVTLVAVDGPDLPDLFPRLNLVTNTDFFYIRFHGRNVRGWRSGNMQKQFDYDYTDQELREWSGRFVPPMTEQARKGFFFFNNHVRAQAPNNAVKLMHQLIEKGLIDHTSVRLNGMGLLTSNP